MKAGEKFDPRVLPLEVAHACVRLSVESADDFEVFAGYLDDLCDMYTSNAVWTPDAPDIARGRAQAINGLLIALASAPEVANRPVKKS
jgi:hypothetical protein